MINWFLKPKHWQLFLLMFGLPIMFEFIMMGSIMSDFVTQPSPDPQEIFSYMKFFPLIMIVFMGAFFGWFWSVAIGLQQKVPANVK